MYFETADFKKGSLEFDTEEKKYGTLTYDGSKYFTFKTPVMNMVYNLSSDNEKKISLCLSLNPTSSKSGARFTRILQYMDSIASRGIQSQGGGKDYYSMVKMHSNKNSRISPSIYFSKDSPDSLNVDLKLESSKEVDDYLKLGIQFSNY